MLYPQEIIINVSHVGYVMPVLRSSGQADCIIDTI